MESDSDASSLLALLPEGILDILPAAAIDYLPEVAIAGALAWGAGLRLYFVIFAFGLAGWMGWWDLPTHLEVLQNPLVVGAAGLMAAVELFADKIPLLDSLWDAAHTFIRIPAGASLAAASFGDSGAAVALAAALLGGTVTAATHFGKSGSRAMANASPEPFSNVALSVAEDVAVFGGSWIAVNYPVAFLLLLGVFLLGLIVLIGFIWRGLRRLWLAKPWQKFSVVALRDSRPPSDGHGPPPRSHG
ncbi:MAG: DUF4126 domain-containing protein [Burkholderiaceae bacterium]